LIQQKYLAQYFNCVYDLKDRLMEEFLGFARFVTYENEDTSALYLAKSRAGEAYLKE